MTGADRPAPGSRPDQAPIEFFGRPACLPLGPARLARATGAAVFVGSCHHDAREGYMLEYTGPIDVAWSGDRRQDVLANARRIASIVEGYVRAHPEQWLMFHPLWPDI